MKVFSPYFLPASLPALLLLATIPHTFLLIVFVEAIPEPSTCTSSASSWIDERDPALKEMIYDVGDGPRPFWAYVEPDLKQFYETNPNPPSLTKVVPEYDGIAGKFINMSNKRVKLYWEAQYQSEQPQLMGVYEPFSVGGTGTYPGHLFFFGTEDYDDNEFDEDRRLIEFVVGDYPENIYVYDPYFVEGDPEQTEQNLLMHLNREDRELYDKWEKTLKFNEQYKNFTGRSYLSNYNDGPRKPPMHFMWRADYFGQEHWITTKETHYERLPPKEDLKPIPKKGNRILKDDEPRLLQEYRVQGQPFLNMSLKVLSVAPRVFEIPNFLSQVEVNHILEIAKGTKLHRSSVGDGSGEGQGERHESSVRTSLNSWLKREVSPVIDTIYRRSADLVRIDEALLRWRSEEEHPELSSRHSLAEELQLVHYGPAQEYTAHHDFGYPKLSEKLNGARFLTILFYLNDDMEGGETSFPRWVNGETFHELEVKPETGKAVLFYSQLPDGNMDDFSQHAAKPVIEGEKWLINLWIWDPTYESKKRDE